MPRRIGEDRAEVLARQSCKGIVDVVRRGQWPASPLFSWFDFARGHAGLPEPEFQAENIFSELIKRAVHAGASVSQESLRALVGHARQKPSPLYGFVFEVVRNLGLNFRRGAALIDAPTRRPHRSMAATFESAAKDLTIEHDGEVAVIGRNNRSFFGFGFLLWHDSVP